ncbi:hypothetical protein [Flagellimonas flava]|uniref:hypothetical protein n=1 Tax=Flagellimonas flava TaxID=570519 RepID=UPI003D657A30
MRRIFYMLSITILSLACKKSTEYGNVEAFNSYEFIDFQSVVKNPNEFYKDTIKIKGQIVISSHNVSITDGSSWIWIDSFGPAYTDDSAYHDLHMKNVEILGVFDFREKGFMDSYEGKFTKLFYIKMY